METRRIYKILQGHEHRNMGRDMEDSRWENNNTKRGWMTQLAHFISVLE